MNVTIQGHNIKITDNFEEIARRKLDRLDRYLPNISEVRVDLSRQNTRRGEDLMIAQITIRHQRGAILRAEEKIPGDIQTALDQAIDNMYRRIQRFKGKQNRKGQERFTATLEELTAAEEIPEIEAYAEVLSEESQIIRRKEIAVMAMNEEEAIEQMELLGHNFFVFFNDATGSINVLYKRGAGGYGLLIPEVG